VFTEESMTHTCRVSQCFWLLPRPWETLTYSDVHMLWYISRESVHSTSERLVHTTLSGHLFSYQIYFFL